MFSKKYSSSGQSGFTLIELMICMIIIMILAASCIPIAKIFIERARVSAGVTAGRCIQNSFTAFLAAPNDAYPIVTNDTELAMVATDNGCPMPDPLNPNLTSPVGFIGMVCYEQDPITGTITFVPCDQYILYEYRLDLSITGVANTYIEVDSLTGVRPRPLP